MKNIAYLNINKYKINEITIGYANMYSSKKHKMHLYMNSYLKNQYGNGLM
jgi:hypothetical protein